MPTPNQAQITPNLACTGTAVDATAAELAIESFLPADSATAAALQAMAGG